MMLDNTFDVINKVDMSMVMQSGGRADKSPKRDRGGLNISVMTANQSAHTAAAGAQTTRHASRKSVAASSYHRKAAATKRERGRT